MKKLLFILLFPLFLFSQVSSTVWDKIKQRDDVLHVYGSGILMATTTEVTYFYTRNITKSLLIGTSTSLAIGVLGKEFIHDKWMGKGVYNVMDIFYDAWGNVIAIIVERCLLDWRNRDINEYYQDPIDDQIRVRKSRKKWSLKRTGLLN